MSEATLPGSIEPDLTGALIPITAILAGGVVACVPLSVAYSTYFDIDATGERVKSCAPFRLLFVALPPRFEFVSGFHDTANVVASVTYTHSLRAGFAVVWSGPLDLAGGSVSSRAVAPISLLTVELVRQVGTQAFGFPTSSSNSREEPPTLWRRALRPRRERTAKWPADLEH